MILVLALMAVNLFLPRFPGAYTAAPVWGSKPVLAFILLDPERSGQLRADLGLTPEQFQAIQQIAQQENKQIQALESKSRAILGNPNLTQFQKTGWVTQSNYNQRVVDVLEHNQQALYKVLGSDLYQKLVRWIETSWSQKQAYFNRPIGVYKIMAKLAPKTYPRSFEIYATRYDAGDRKIVALPDKCLKFANGGALQCTGYAYEQGYSVAISYEGNLVVALVAESGPWNVDDNYWSKPSDPQPRRMFADLPLGVPEAQAAYFNGYNGGLDQFGRLVTSPVAIDISKALAADLGLGPGNNLVTVSFLWTEGWDSAKSPSGKETPGSGQDAPVAAIDWETVTPNPDGAVIHIVKAGQTLVGIATVYNIPLADLLALNNLTMQSIIQPGDKIAIKPADPTRTPTQIAVPTAKPTQYPTATPTPAPIPAVTPLPSLQATPVSTALADDDHLPVDWILVVIMITALAGLGLLAWGLTVQRKKS
jgi:LysM repeat protein